LGSECPPILTFWHEELNGNTNSEGEEMLVCFRANMHEIVRKAVLLLKDNKPS